MGTSANENIALRISSSADLGAVREARAETSALGTAVAASANEAASAQQKLTSTTDQGREAWRRAGGDMERFKAELAAIVAGENQLASATAKATSEVQKQRSAVLPGPSAPQLGPAVPGGGAPTAMRQELEKIPPAARQAGNAMGLLASAAGTGTGSLSGLATATGNVAQGMSLMSNSAKFAASTAGIGTLIAAIGVLIGLAIEAKKALNEIPEGQLAAAAAEHVKNLKTQKQITDELAHIDAQRTHMAEALKRGDQEALQAVVNLDAKKAALYARSRDIELAARDQAQQDAKEAEAREEKRKHLAQAAADHLFKVRNDLGVAADLATQNEYTQKKNAIEREAADQRRKNAELVQSAGERSEAEFAIEATRMYKIDALAKQTAKEADARRKQQIAAGLAGYTALSSAVKNHGTVVGAMAKAAADAVRLHEIYVEGKKAGIMAKIEFAAATAAFAAGNVGGGALHLAAAAGYGAAALAAGAEAVGVVSGGGGGGSGGGSGSLGDSTTFQPRDGSGGGGQTINLYTVNPYSRETMAVVSYELERGKVLNRPIQLPPTVGLVGA